MAEKTINTRILLKYDTYSNWTTKNPVLKAGEMAIATIASGSTQEVNSVTAPQVLIKVGDGTSAYNSLPFASAKAADVYAWAKESKKPTYSAGEITGIGDYIATYVDETLGISVDTDTQYRITKVDDYNYKLQSKAKGEADTAFADVSTIVIPKYDDTEVKADISALETLVGTTAVATQITNAINALKLADTYAAKTHGHAMSEVTGLSDALAGKETAGEAAKVQSALNTYKTNNDAAIAAIKDGTTIDSFKDVETALAGKQAAGDYATNAQAQGYANAKDAAIQAAQDAADAAQDDVDALTEVVDGKADKATTLAGYGITDAYTKANGEALAERVSDNETAISTLNGTGAGSVDKKITDAINEFAAKVSDDGTVNTYKELIDYAAEHGAEFTELVGEVEENTNAIATLNGSGAGSVAKAISDAIAAENLSQYATDTEMADATGRISTLETNIAKKANDADLAAIAKTGNINDLVQTSGDVLIFDCGNATF